MHKSVLLKIPLIYYQLHHFNKNSTWNKILKILHIIMMFDIDANVMILQGGTVNNASIVGARSIVTKVVLP